LPKPVQPKGWDLSMKKQLFNELLESVGEGGAILRGEREASRTFSFEESDVQRLRRDRLAKECTKLQRSEQAPAEEDFLGEAE
jgi:hypothetical protein